jgi:hypothetical protein
VSRKASGLPNWTCCVESKRDTIGRILKPRTNAKKEQTHNEKHDTTNVRERGADHGVIADVADTDCYGSLRLLAYATGTAHRWGGRQWRRAESLLRARSRWQHLP